VLCTSWPMKSELLGPWPHQQGCRQGAKISASQHVSQPLEQFCCTATLTPHLQQLLQLTRQTTRRNCHFYVNTLTTSCRTTPPLLPPSFPILAPSAPHETSSWPPRFHKLLLHFGPRPGDASGATCDFAYCDARRFGRVKLCGGDPADSEAISKLGFDPLLDMPDLQAFKVGVGGAFVYVRVFWGGGGVEV